MSIRKTLMRILPAYRARDAILGELESISYAVSTLNKKLEDMERKNDYLFYCLQHMDGESEMETKQRVFLNLPKAGGIVRDFQSVANYILQRTADVCEENGIAFFLEYGTLLGAVRHHGFIPWDDDVDIGMMRDDCNRLMGILKDDPELEMRRFYRYTRPGYEAAYIIKIKLRKSDKFFIDVFPFDFLDTSPESYRSAWEEADRMCVRFHDELQKVFRENGFPDDCCVPTRSDVLDEVVPEVEKRYLEELNQRFADKNCPERAVCDALDRIRKYRRKMSVFPSSVFFPLRCEEGIFEGRTYPIPNQTEKVLETLYGDYMSLPKAIEHTHAKELGAISGEDAALVDWVRDMARPGE